MLYKKRRIAYLFILFPQIYMAFTNTSISNSLKKRKKCYIVIAPDSGHERNDDCKNLSNAHRIAQTM